MTAINHGYDAHPGFIKPGALYIAESSAWLALAFIINTMLVHAAEFPGLYGTLAGFGLPFEADYPPQGAAMWIVGLLQTATYVIAALYPLGVFGRYGHDHLVHHRDRLAGVANYIITAAFFAVLLIGIVDAVISFLRVENLFIPIFGDAMDVQIGRAAVRGAYLQVPLMVLSLVIALFVRGHPFVWLAALVVLSELLIVVARFIFSYEQAFMGDLVRFWYAALFLFASAYTLMKEGHVRVDVVYANFSDRAKARANIIGSLLLGLPLCWIVLLRGIWGKSSMITSPLLNFEISQSGAGMFVKYLMAGFLLVFVITMLFQFASYVAEYLRRFEEGYEPEPVHQENL